MVQVPKRKIKMFTRNDDPRIGKIVNILMEKINAKVSECLLRKCEPVKKNDGWSSAQLGKC